MTEPRHTQGVKCPKEFKGPFKYYSGCMLRCQSTKGGDTAALDIRGYGYLTGKGHGAHGYSDEKATDIQDQLGKYAEVAMNAYPLLMEALTLVRDSWEDPELGWKASAAVEAALRKATPEGGEE